MGDSSASELIWTVHRLRENRFRSIVLIILLGLICLLVYAAFLNLWLTVIAAVLLVGSLRGFFLPVRYTLNQDKIIIRTSFGQTAKNWSLFKSYYVDKNGILLSPFEGKSRLENFRGVYLLCNGNTKEVEEFIKSRIAR